MAASSEDSGVRKRRVDSRRQKETQTGDSGGEHAADSDSGSGTEHTPGSLQTGTYWLSRIVLLRSVAFIYLVAFSVAFNQNKQLIGEHGLMPCKDFLNSVKRYVGGKIGMAALAYTPSILWFLDWGHMDANLDGIALVGMALSASVLVTGMANMVIMATLWVLYHSLVNVGQLWYSFGWESQLLETGFLAIFLCPVWTLSQVPRRCPPSLVCIWTFRWLIVRIMLGAGLIKIRGDQCWRDLTCMDYHYEAAETKPWQHITVTAVECFSRSSASYTEHEVLKIQFVCFSPCGMLDCSDLPCSALCEEAAEGCLL
ncbi:unnamed protein product [Pleuronectes platessa]|uniref:Lipase maturation factor n=1 Tax=Pleuronectes platessa TaxID=8262 RepID=A0A9N7U437_PLEPL|nr:unnamed protein product [Pleuronectes platessa]